MPAAASQCPRCGLRHSVYVLLHDDGRVIDVGEGLPNHETNHLAAPDLWRETRRQ
jgi:hypothetical protein